jgi:hypothetical protein
VKSNPREVLFSKAYSSLFSVGNSTASLPRVTASITAFEKWKGPVRPATARAGSASTPAKTILTNETLVEMARAGLTDENLILAIDAASDVDFDTSPNALIALAKGGVSRNVIAHMQKKKR